MGKGTERRWKRHAEEVRGRRNLVLQQLLRFYLDIGVEPENLLHIVREGMTDQDALLLERAQIAEHGLASKGGQLLNIVS